MAAGKAAVQARGYNALSFRELAAAVGIKSASVHYHFPTKGDLGAALAQRYAQDGAVTLTALEAADPDPAACMAGYAAIFRAALENDNRMCLCGIMSAEMDDLPAQVRVEVGRFAAMNAAWLAALVRRWKPGLNADEAEARGSAIFAAMEGAQLVARGGGGVALYDRTVAAYRVAGLIP